VRCIEEEPLLRTVPGDPTGHLVACHFPLANDEVLESAPVPDASVLAEADTDDGGDGRPGSDVAKERAAADRISPALGDSL
jgi:hypothetical protein